MEELTLCKSRLDLLMNQAPSFTSVAILLAPINGGKADDKVRGRMIFYLEIIKYSQYNELFYKNLSNLTLVTNRANEDAGTKFSANRSEPLGSSLKKGCSPSGVGVEFFSKASGC